MKHTRKNKPRRSPTRTRNSCGSSSCPYCSDNRTHKNRRAEVNAGQPKEAS